MQNPISGSCSTVGRQARELQLRPPAPSGEAHVWCQHLHVSGRSGVCMFLAFVKLRRPPQQEVFYPECAPICGGGVGKVYAAGLKRHLSGNSGLLCVCYPQRPPGAFRAPTHARISESVHSSSPVVCSGNQGFHSPTPHPPKSLGRYPEGSLRWNDGRIQARSSRDNKASR